MPWVKLDDHFDENPKIAAAGPLGLALYVTGLAYCNRNLSDGFIPWAKARTLLSWDYLESGSTGDPLRRIAKTYGDERGEQQVMAFVVTSDDVIELLLSAGLWDVVDGGFQVHDYGDFQPLKAEVRAVREVRAEAGRRGGEAKAKQSARNLPSKSPSKTEAKVYPDPDPDPDPVSVTDPVPNPHTEGARKRATCVDEAFKLVMYERFPSRTQTRIDDEIADALGHTAAKKRTDLQAYVRNWLVRAFDEPRGSPTPIRTGYLKPVAAGQFDHLIHRSYE